MTGWTDDRVAELRRLWGEGNTSGEIAAELGGVSRNAVCGKLYRLGLMTPRADRPKRTERPRKARQRPYTPKRVSSGPAPKVAPIPLPEGAFTGPAGAPAAIMAIGRATCRWPIGHPKDADFRFCGATAADGRCFCPHHAAIAYIPASKRSDADADLVDAEHAANRVRA